MARIVSIVSRRILNSHGSFTSEFIVRLDDGSIGVGGSPQGETIGIYEDRGAAGSAEDMTRTILEAVSHETLDQESFDRILEAHIGRFGRNNTYALSLAFFNATRQHRSLFDLFGVPEAPLRPPCLCCNILNGGRHAYTNPVLSDFPEYLLVARGNDIESVIAQHNEMQRAVRERLLKQPKTVVAGNPVNRFASADNRECLDFLLQVRDSLGFAKDFDPMIDASAGDLLTDGRYRFALTDGRERSGDELREYWAGLISQYHLGFLEDPFAETEDEECWRRLTASQQACKIIGDNFYSSSADRIRRGAAEGCSHGVIIKPNQAGSVTAVREAVETARQTGQVAITSHRSISTEETFLSVLTCLSGVKYIKIGPLWTDYSSIVRLNEIIRLTGKP